MKISVITVCYNSVKTIEDTLISVAAQTWPHVEHIVIDGGSTDGTQSVLERYADKIAHCVIEPDEGIYDAMNKGARLATGDVLGFLNSDDIYSSPDTLQHIAQAAFAHPVPDGVYGDLIYTRHADTQRVVRYWKAGAFTPGKLKMGWMPPHPTLYVRRELFSRLGGFDCQYSISADYEFILRLFGSAEKTFAYVPEVFIKMRVGGVSNRSLKTIFTKSKEDLLAIKRHKIGGIGVLLLKNIQKIEQYLI